MNPIPPQPGQPGTLYLIPVTLGDDTLQLALPQGVIDRIRQLDTFVVENERTARRFLGTLNMSKPVRELAFASLNEHTTAKELPELIRPLLAGKDVGLMSEAGCPGIADPGALLVALAHQHHVPVQPLVGPSSILLALMASGFNGQRFTFHGYLPSEKAARITALKQLEQTSRKHHETQIFIETPYRNDHMLEDILATCQPQTRLCVACNLTLPTEQVFSRPVTAWKKAPLPSLHKQPAVFLLLA